MNKLDTFLDKKTMYRLVLESLAVLAVCAVLAGFAGFIAYPGLAMLGSLITLCLVCYGSNYLFAKLFGAFRNLESAYITALILFFILAPATDAHGYTILVLAGTVAMASKYVLTIHKKHFFNPAAISVFLLGLLGIDAVVWWVGTPFLLPLGVVIGLLILKKTNKFKMFFTFFGMALVTIIGFAFYGHASVYDTLMRVLLSWPIVFFGTVMLTEPMTTPPFARQQTIYGALVGIFFGAQFHIGPLFSTPELALVLGNIYTAIVSPKFFAKLILQERKQLSDFVHEYTFSCPKNLPHLPGQYLEWTLPHTPTDTRGMRRHFTIASSPTEDHIKISIKVDPKKGSSFKQKLLDMQVGDSIVASGLAGEFILPKATGEKLVFVAGGIGITPFRSMIQYLLDRNERRDIVVLYSCVKKEDFVYKDLLDKAEKELGIKTMYIVTSERILDASMIAQYIPDVSERTLYLSGPRSMVVSIETLLQSMNIKKNRIKTDFFPGFAS